MHGSRKGPNGVNALTTILQCDGPAKTNKHICCAFGALSVDHQPLCHQTRAVTCSVVSGSRIHPCAVLCRCSRLASGQRVIDRPLGATLQGVGPLTLDCVALFRLSSPDSHNNKRRAPLHCAPLADASSVLPPTKSCTRASFATHKHGICSARCGTRVLHHQCTRHNRDLTPCWALPAHARVPTPHRLPHHLLHTPPSVHPH
jgi:hypothetical protein